MSFQPFSSIAGGSEELEEDMFETSPVLDDGDLLILLYLSSLLDEYEEDIFRERERESEL